MDILGNGPAADRARHRLAHDLMAWLTTVAPDGRPQSSPVWFWWDGSDFLVWSRPTTQKVRNVAAHPLVSLNLDGNGQGGDIVTIEARARFEADGPAAGDVPGFVAKYAEKIASNGWTPESFASDYSLLLRISPERARRW